MSASTDLTAQITASVHRLVTATSAAAQTSEMAAYLATAAKFYHYSAGNIFLIMCQMPEAQQVAGFGRWLQLHRYVKKGEHGIKILAPVIYKRDKNDPTDTRDIKGFKAAFVFDVSQTDGEPLPPPPDWKSPAQDARLQAALVDFARANKIEIEIVDTIHGEAQGSSAGGKIQLTRQAGTKTLIHELAHELLHHGADRLQIDRETKELEAEAVAYVVADHFNLPDLKSPNYLALWDANEKTIMQRLDRIRKTAAQIIEAVEPRRKDTPQ